MRVFGIDCGTEVTGFGVVETDDAGRQPRLALKAMGAIRLVKSKTTAERLEQVYLALSTELERWKPDAVAIEEVFYSVNAKSALKLGQVRGRCWRRLRRGCRWPSMRRSRSSPAWWAMEWRKRSRCSLWWRGCWSWPKSRNRPTPPMPWPSPSATSTPRRRFSCKEWRSAKAFSAFV